MTDEHTKHPHYAAAMAAVEKMKAAGWNGVLSYCVSGRYGSRWECRLSSPLPLPRDVGDGYGSDPYKTLRAAVWATVNPAGFYPNYPDRLMFEAVDLMRQFGLEWETPAEEVKPEFELGGEGG